MCIRNKNIRICLYLGDGMRRKDKPLIRQCSHSKSAEMSIWYLKTKLRRYDNISTYIIYLNPTKAKLASLLIMLSGQRHFNFDANCTWCCNSCGKPRNRVSQLHAKLHIVPPPAHTPILNPAGMHGAHLFNSLFVRCAHRFNTIWFHQTRVNSKREIDFWRTTLCIQSCTA